MTEIFFDDYSVEKSEHYSYLERLGEGTFGEVRKGVDKITGEVVAIKFVRILSKKDGVPKALFREMESLKQLCGCPYIIKLHDIFTTESNLCLVMEYLVSDMSEVISQLSCQLSRSQLKSYFQMILQGVAFCHSMNIIHRDIKPSNLLLSSSGEVKLADFGLARIYERGSKEPMSHQVATRQYRAPELLFASRHYTPAVDMWSVAVVMSELVSSQMLFPGNNDIDQMHKVFQVLGSPSLIDWPEVERLPDYSKVCFPDMKPLELSLVLPQADKKELDFIKHFLVLNPSRRSSAEEALQMPYFYEYPAPAPTTSLPVPFRPAPKKKPALVSTSTEFMERVLAFGPNQEHYR